MNDEDLYSLSKEEINEDPSNTENLETFLNINDKEDSDGFRGLSWAIYRATPWIIDEVEDKIQSNLGTSDIHSLSFLNLQAESWVANQFFDLLLSQNFADSGLEKLKM